MGLESQHNTIREVLSLSQWGCTCWIILHMCKNGNKDHALTCGLFIKKNLIIESVINSMAVIHLYSSLYLI